MPTAPRPHGTVGRRVDTVGTAFPAGPNPPHTGKWHGFAKSIRAGPKYPFTFCFLWKNTTPQKQADAAAINNFNEKLTY